MQNGTIAAQQPQIDPLTSIRFLAALAVVLFHYQTVLVPYLFPAIRPYGYFLNGGWLGVDLFFILSGFIISYNYFEDFEQTTTNKYCGFLVKRLARIYPVHLVTSLIVFIPVVYSWGLDAFTEDITAAPLYDFSLLEFIMALFLVQGWPLPTSHAWNGVSWSVSCEWLAYLLFPLIVMCFRRLNNIVIIAVVYVFLLVVVLFLGGLTALDLTGWSVLGIVRIAAGFPMGVLLYRLYVMYPASELSPPTVLMKLLFVFATLLVCCTAWYKMSILWVIPYFSWMILSFARDRYVPGLLRNRVFIYGGKISYSLYLCHGVCLTILIVFYPAYNYIKHPEIYRISYAAAYFATTFLLTILVYHFVEVPARKYILRKWG